MTGPFEPLESASDRILTLKVVLLPALTSLKRVGDLQAFSVSETCMDFAPGLVKVTLRPRPGYIPKVLSTSFRSQVVTLHSFHPPLFASSEDERLLLIRLQVLRSCLFEPTVHSWFIIGPDRQRFSAWRVWYIVPEAFNAALSSPMKENVSGYSRNPCSLNRE